MKKRIKNFIKKIDKKIKYSLLSILLIIFIITSFLGIKIYLNYIEEKCSLLTNKQEVIYEIDETAIGSNGFNIFNISSYIEKNVKNVDDVIKLKFNSDNFTIYLNKGKIIDDVQYYNLSKIVDSNHKVNAQLNIENINSIEFKSGNITNDAVIKFNMKDSHEYLAIMLNKYYLLGEDIESISFMDEHFFYVSYNTKYKILYDAPNCDQTIIDQIENFNMSDIYYSYGKINFMESFYQKLSSQQYTVQSRCDELSK